MTTTSPNPGPARPRPRPAQRLAAGVLAAVVAVLGLTARAATDLATAPPAAAAPTGVRTTGVNLFQWTWNAVASECTRELGPDGYGYVQVSPPQEHVRLAGQWWTSYQPVSYRIESKLGTRAEFAAMVTTCRDAGVTVIADVVINHMSGQSSGTGWAGTQFTTERYPGPDGGYAPQDFNDCRTDIASYQDRYQVQSCRLVGLQDLRTGSDYVRQEIANYLNDLIGLGVRGFRVDAAKHIPAADLAAIKARLSDQSVYVVHEVIGASGEAIQPSEYLGSGDVHEFSYGRHLKSVLGSGALASLRDLSSQSWLLPSDRAGVFVDNHDTERNGETLSVKDGARYRIANVFMLAYPYGWPTVYSGYSFTDKDAGPAQQPSGEVDDAVCGQAGWTCAHRWNETAHMVGFRNAVTGTAVGQWWDNGSGQIAFARGAKGYVAINAQGASFSRTFTTSLPAGTYCDVISGAPTSSGCSGTAVTVGTGGAATFTVPATGAVALHVAALAGGGTSQSPTTSPTPVAASVSFGVDATTVWGQNIFVVGDVPGLGSWAPSAAVALSSATYPVWRASVALPAGTVVQYKYVRKDAAGNVTWETGANRTVTVPASGVLTLTDAWRG